MSVESVIQSNDHREPVEVLCEEFLERWRKGEAPSIEEYAAAHESLRDEILAVFPAMLAMENVKENRSQSSGARPIQLQVDRLEQLGDYKIIREIGRGGMAIVYEAEQQSLHRRVAVKVYPQQAFDDSKHLKRFQREAKTIGSLHHNNIVPVFGIGEQDGLHYFVMQLLRGVPLNSVIAELRRHSVTPSGTLEKLQKIIGKSQESGSNPAIKQETDPAPAVPASRSDKPPVAFARNMQYWRRVAELGRQVAEGLHYAHQQGVLHRDIKPSNLVIDADWRVWITDFGLATDLSQDQLSQTGDVVGTLRYMPPERLNGQSDIRSDIYSLGLTLYELLTFQPAFDGFSRGALTQQVLNCRPTTPRAIYKDIPTDLETIVLKAISRESEARYQSAQELADDLQNFCKDRPIKARPASSVERIHRWSKRNPAMAALSTALALCIMISLGTVLVNWRLAVHEKSRAQSEGARAENNLILALESMDRILENFETDWMSHPIAPDTEAIESNPSLQFVVSDQSAVVLQEALLFYEQFAEQNAFNPRLLNDTAKAYQRVGGIHERLGQFELAEVAYRKYVDTLKAKRDPDSTHAVAIAGAHNSLANVLHARYKHQDAFNELLKAQTLLAAELVSSANPTEEVSRTARFELATAYSSMGEVLWWLGNHQQSVQKHRAAIVLFQQLVDEQPLATYRLSLARAYRKYYLFADRRKDRNYSREIQGAAEDLLLELVEDYPNVPDYQCELSEMLTSITFFGRKDSEDKEAELLTQASQAIELAEQLVEHYPAIPRYQAALAWAVSNKAKLMEGSDLPNATAMHAASVERYTLLCERFPSVVHYLSFLSRSLHDKAQCLKKLNLNEQACGTLRQAISRQREYLEKRGGTTFGKKRLSEYLCQLADMEQSAGELGIAERLRKEADSTWSPTD